MKASSEAGANMFNDKVKDLFPMMRLKDEAVRAKIEKSTASQILEQTKFSQDDYVALRDKMPASEIESKAKADADKLAKAMVDGGSMGTEEWAWKGISNEFVNALANSGYRPGPNDPLTKEAIGNLIAAKVADYNLPNKGTDFNGQFHVMAYEKKDGYHIAAYTSDYRGRDGNGEKLYKNSQRVTIAVVPHDEISKRLNETGNQRQPGELMESKAYCKATGLRLYLNALMLTSNF